MRKLFEIIEDLKSGKKPSHDECYWAVLALDALSTLDGSAIRRLAKRVEAHGEKTLADLDRNEWFRRWKDALHKDPKTYLGPNHDPSNPEYQKRRQAALKLYNKVAKELEQKKKDGIDG